MSWTTFKIGIAWALLVLMAFPGMSAPRWVTPDIEIASWTTESGLPGESVTSIEQTSEGFLWIGTTRGLARFDGWKFVNVSASTERRPGGLQDLKITSLCVGVSNKLFFGTDRHGVFRLDPDLAPPLRAVGVGLESEKINCMGADGERVWIGTDSGLFVFEGEKFRRFGLTDELAGGVTALQVTRSNGVWLTTRTGLKRVRNGVLQEGGLQVGEEKPAFRGVFEDRAGSLWCFGDTYLLNFSTHRRFNYFRGGGATQLRVWSICEGKPGELWIGTGGQGLFHFGGNRFTSVSFREGRDHSDVLAVFRDREGQTWVGTRTGLLRLKPRTVRWLGQEIGAVRCLAQDIQGRILAGFERSGLWTYVTPSGTLQPAAGLIPGASESFISSLYARPDSTLWMGTSGNGLLRILTRQFQRITTADGLSEDTVLTVCGGVMGRVWVSTADGKAHRLREQELATFGVEHGLTGSPVTALIRATPGGVWAGTARGEFLRFENERFRLLERAPSLENKPATALYEDAQGQLWAGTDGGGVGGYRGGRWRTWTTTHGLPDNRILAIQGTPQGTLWIATARGICRVPDAWLAGEETPGQTHRPASPLPLIVRFPEKAGKGMGGWPRSLAARDGTLWFATEAGMVTFSPAELQTQPPPVNLRIETILAGGSSIPVPRPFSVVSLPARLQSVEVRFTAPCLSGPEKIEFRHKLEGFDADWVDSSETRTARYGKLGDGKYRLEIQCRRTGEMWAASEVALPFTVATPLWRTPLALGLETALLAVTVAAVVRGVSHRRLIRQLERAEHQRATERERARIARDMHDELGAKLTKISFLSERARNDLCKPGEQNGSTAKLESIATTSRELLHSLDEIVWAVNPKNDRLESLAAYLGQYAAEYLQNTAVELDLRMPGALPEIPLSAEVRHNLFLAFQEALGNALKHSGATRVHIAMELDRNVFSILIRDNGRGLPPESAERPARPRRKGTGLAGMLERLEKSGGSCELSSSPGTGTTVVLRIRIPHPCHQTPYPATAAISSLSRDCGDLSRDCGDQLSDKL